MKLALPLCCSGLGLAGLAAAAWPEAPLTTSGASMVDATGAVVTYAGVNWPGAADVMIPEGLQYQSVAAVVAQLKAAGVNVIRLTYAIEMVDQIYDNGGADVTVAAALEDALGQANGSRVLAEILAANPAFGENVTRLEVSGDSLKVGDAEGVEVSELSCWNFD